MKYSKELKDMVVGGQNVLLKRLKKILYVGLNRTKMPLPHTKEYARVIQRLNQRISLIIVHDIFIIKFADYNPHIPKHLSNVNREN